MQQIADWLEKFGLKQYAQRFAENDIDFAILRDLTDQDLEKIGVASLGHRRKLLRAIATLDDTPAAAASAAPTASPVVPEPAPSREVAGERRYLTVMFCDLVGSTSISAGLDAEEWRDLVGAYLEAASAAVTEMGGHVAKKLGDGLMALFGYPVAQENDAERAARAALAIQRALARAQPQKFWLGQAGTCCPYWSGIWSSGCRYLGRDFRRRAERRGARAGPGRAGCGFGHRRRQLLTDRRSTIRLR